MTKRIYFSDIDGTMIDKKSRSFESLGNAIEGMSIIPVTGRHLHGLEKELKLLFPENTGVFANGALCVYKNGTSDTIVDKKFGSDGYDSFCSLLEVLQQENIHPSLQYNEVVCDTTANLLKLVESNKKSLIGSNIVYLRFEKEKKEEIFDILRDGSYAFNSSLNDASLLITQEGVDKGTGLSAFIDFLLDKKIINKEEYSLFFAGNDYNDRSVFRMDTIQGMLLEKIFVGNHFLKEEIQQYPEMYSNIEFLENIPDYHAYLRSLTKKV